MLKKSLNFSSLSTNCSGSVHRWFEASHVESGVDPHGPEELEPDYHWVDHFRDWE